MKTVKLISWNVNGIRAAVRKGFNDWLAETQPDILGIQETKGFYEQVEKDLVLPDGYQFIWNAAERKGYSGVATFYKPEPLNVSKGFGIDRFDTEGRVSMLEYPEFTVLNIYFPNGQRDQQRLDYKMDFYDATLEFCENLRTQGKKLIVFGDYNTAHTEIDLRNPKANEQNSGFLPIERAWLDKWISHGYVDVFRRQHPNEPDHYTWWTYRMNARARNIGWRIDYFFVTKDLLDHVSNAYILPDVMGSDHCPLGLDLQFKSSRN